MQYEIKQVDKFRFIEEGEGEPLVLLHGLFGALSNFVDLIEYFKKHYKVVVPMLPCLSLISCTLPSEDWKNSFTGSLKTGITGMFTCWVTHWVAISLSSMFLNIRKG